MREADMAVLPDVRKIAVLRPSAIGDFMMALPALHALRTTYPQAEIMYIGRQWHADFLNNRAAPIDRVVIIPPCPGVGAPFESIADPLAIQRFIDDMRAQKLDLAVQLYGGGRYSNPFIKQLGARMTIGMRASDAESLDRWIAYGELQNRRLQMLAVTALVGANSVQLGPELQVTMRDRQEAQQVVEEAQGKTLVVLQPGSTDYRRCWPPERFASVADQLAEQGALIAINGSTEEAALVAQVLECMRYPALDLAGRLSLSGLCGVLERADLLISNDTGPLHLALAIGTPAVGIYWLTNLIEFAPLRQDLHAAALSLRTHCPVCGEENLKSRCPHDVSFVDGVTVDEVARLATGLLKR